MKKALLKRGALNTETENLDLEVADCDSRSGVESPLSEFQSLLEAPGTKSRPRLL